MATHGPSSWMSMNGPSIASRAAGVQLAVAEDVTQRVLEAVLEKGGIGGAILLGSFGAAFAWPAISRPRRGTNRGRGSTILPGTDEEQQSRGPTWRTLPRKRRRSFTWSIARFDGLPTGFSACGRRDLAGVLENGSRQSRRKSSRQGTGALALVGLRREMPDAVRIRAEINFFENEFTISNERNRS